MLLFESRDTGVLKDDRNKLFAGNEKQIDNHTLMLDIFTHTCQLCVPTIIKVSKNTFWCGCCSLLIFLAKKAAKGIELQFLYTQGTSKVEQ